MTERELDRRAAHRLTVIRDAQEVTHNVSKTCRDDGITRQAYYKWLRPYDEDGVAALRDGSSRPHTSPLLVPDHSGLTARAPRRRASPHLRGPKSAFRGKS